MVMTTATNWIHDLAADAEVVAQPVPPSAGRGQDAGAERADDAADAVDAEDVERVVIAELVLHRGDEEVADRR